MDFIKAVQEIIPKKTNKCYEEGEAFNIQDISPEKGGLTEISDVEFKDKKVYGSES